MNIKKAMLSILTITMVSGSIGMKNISALTTNDDKYDEEIKDAIVAGDGTFDNPYVLDFSKAEEFHKYLEKVTNTSHDKMARNTNDNLLRGTSHNNQTKGAYWNYKSGGGNAMYNGATIVRKVEYVSKQDVVEICASFASASFINTFKATIGEAAGKSLQKGIEVLVKKGFAKTAATSLAKFIGCGSTYFQVAVLVAELNTFFQQKPYVTAKNQNKGVTHTEYQIAHQGNWFSYSNTDVWTNYPTAKEPFSDYGKGTFVSR